MEYKYIKKFLPELKYFKNYRADDSTELAIRASDLEAELAKGVEMFGLYNVYPINLSLDQHVMDTHSGLLIGYQPIKSSEPVSRDIVVGKLETALDYIKNIDEKESIRQIIRSILENGVK